MSESLHKPTVAILASGGGTTAEAFIHATKDGLVNAEVGLVVCNNPPEVAGIYERITGLNAAYRLDIRTVMINGNTHPQGKTARGQTLAESAAICELVDEGGFDHVALMGYMKKVGGELLETYGWQPGYDSKYQARMSNTHPGPLPETVDTHGIGASERVLELGMQASRHTVHIVAERIDEGPKLAEHPVAILEGDTAQDLFERTQRIEKAHLPYDIDNFLREQRAYLGAA